MGLLNLNFFSQSLRKQSSMVVLFPDRITHPGPYPVLYLLHGLGDDSTMWTRMTSLERHARHLPLIIAMPDVGRSFYCDAVYGPQYEKLVIEDVIGLIDRLFNTRNNREGRCVSGLSMGGYGAIKLALKYPELFISATGHSGAYYRHFELISDQMQQELEAVFGGPQIPPLDNCHLLAEQADPTTLPALRFDCGIDDFLLEVNRDFHQHLQDLGIAHEYDEFAGGHAWPYWDEHIQESLAFHCRHLGIEPEELAFPAFVRPDREQAQ